MATINKKYTHLDTWSGSLGEHRDLDAKSAHITGSLVVEKTGSFGYIDVTNVNVTQGSNISGNGNVGGNLVVTGSLTVNGSVVFTDLTASNAKITTELSASAMYGNLIDVIEIIAEDRLTANNTLVAQGEATFFAMTNLSGGLYVNTADSTFQTDVHMSGGLDVQNDIRAANLSAIAGNVSASANLKGTALQVDGLSTLGRLTVTGGVNGPLYITGSMTNGSAGLVASGANSHAEGSGSLASASGSHAEGDRTTASGLASHAEGSLATASGPYSHAEGELSVASAQDAHAEGKWTTASALGAHAEGTGSIASGQFSHAEGNKTTAQGSESHAEGSNTLALGSTSHAEGAGTTATGLAAHAAGYQTHAWGDAAFAAGVGTVASGAGETLPQSALGKWNTLGNVDSLLVVGDGLDASNRHDVFSVKSGSVEVTGSLRVAGTIYGTIAGTVGAPGLDTQVLFNNNGNVAASSGVTILSGALTASTLNVGGVATVGDKLSLTLASGVGLSVTSNAEVTGTLKVLGASMSASSALEVGTTATVGSTLTVNGTGASALSVPNGSGSVGGDLTVSGQIKAQGAGTGLAVTNSASIGGDLLVQGDLWVSGAQVIMNVEEVLVKDKNMVIAYVTGSNPDGQAPNDWSADGGGLTITSSVGNKDFYWRRASAGYGGFVVNQDFLPETTLTYDLGHSGLRWKKIWADQLSVATGLTASNLLVDHLSASVIEVRDLTASGSVEFTAASSVNFSAGMTVSGSLLMTPGSVLELTGSGTFLTVGSGSEISTDPDALINFGGDVNVAGLYAAGVVDGLTGSFGEATVVSGNLTVSAGNIAVTLGNITASGAGATIGASIGRFDNVYATGNITGSNLTANSTLSGSTLQALSATFSGLTVNGVSNLSGQVTASVGVQVSGGNLEVTAGVVSSSGGVTTLGGVTAEGTLSGSVVTANQGIFNTLTASVNALFNTVTASAMSASTDIWADTIHIQHLDLGGGGGSLTMDYITAKLGLVSSGTLDVLGATTLNSLTVTGSAGIISQGGIVSTGSLVVTGGNISGSGNATIGGNIKSSGTISSSLALQAPSLTASFGEVLQLSSSNIQSTNGTFSTLTASSGLLVSGPADMQSVAATSVTASGNITGNYVTAVNTVSGSTVKSTTLLVNGCDLTPIPSTLTILGDGLTGPKSGSFGYNIANFASGYVAKHEIEVIAIDANSNAASWKLSTTSVSGSVFGVTEISHDFTTANAGTSGWDIQVDTTGVVTAKMASSIESTNTFFYMQVVKKMELKNDGTVPLPNV